LISEFVIGTPPLAANFPRRNRIVAALSRGTLVVEAAVQSGSLITARLAAEMGREVMAIPGSIHAPQSRGAHALIKQGAALIESAQDVLDALSWRGALAANAAPETLGTPDEPAAASGDPLLEALGHDPVALDALAARTGMSPAELGSRLLMLELDGLVSRLPGQLFQRSARA
jgi:DNA processing protein